MCFTWAVVYGSSLAWNNTLFYIPPHSNTPNHHPIANISTPTPHPPNLKSTYCFILHQDRIFFVIVLLFFFRFIWWRFLFTHVTYFLAFKWNSTVRSTTSNDVVKWNLIEGVVLSCFFVFSWSGILIHGQSAQHRNTHFQCGSECLSFILPEP